MIFVDKLVDMIIIIYVCCGNYKFFYLLMGVYDFVVDGLFG